MLKSSHYCRQDANINEGSHLSCNDSVGTIIQHNCSDAVGESPNILGSGLGTNNQLGEIRFAKQIVST